MFVKSGERLRSQVSEVQVIVLKAPDHEIELTCGGQAMIDVNATPASPAATDVSGATVLGKRYRFDGDGAVEVLVTRAGAGTLAIDGVDLVVAETKALPASD
jgi:hypothetical protein